jgi:hypothetical protein
MKLCKRSSVNRVVITLLQDHLGESSKRQARRYHDLDELAGVWRKPEADAFEEALTKQRTIDPEMWK